MKGDGRGRRVLGLVRSNCHERDRSRLLEPDDQTMIAKNGLSSLSIVVREDEIGRIRLAVIL